MSILHTLIGAALVAVPLAQAPQTPPAPRPDTAAPAPHSGHAAKADKAEKTAASAETFIRHAAQGGTAEIALAQLAKDKASNADVKAYAERLERDHSKANDELKSLASSKHVTL